MHDKESKTWFTYDSEYDLLKEFKRKDIDLYRLKKDKCLNYDNDTINGKHL